MPEGLSTDQSRQRSPQTTPSGAVATLSKNVLISLARVGINALVALILPAYLTHHLPVTTYGAWMLILQLAAYVTLLDFGVQTGIAKFVAEYDARSDHDGAGRHASAGLVLMSIMALLGIILTFVLAWQVPRLFHSMPSSLYGDVRVSVLLVGLSSCFTLISSVFSAAFFGLQRYVVPTAVSIINRILFTAAIVIAVKLHGSLTAMGAVVAVVNIITALIQIAAWRKLATGIRISINHVDTKILQPILRYFLSLAIWQVGMLCVTGLDIVLVGHYAYDQTAFYSIATLPTSFMLVILSSVLSPLMPASSALSTQRTPLEMGNILTRITRYSTILLLLTGLPLIVCGLPILNAWVGPFYALHSLQYMQILVLANIIRNLCGPYATLLIATGNLRSATVAAILEAVVNLGGSIFFARHYGAIGVAFGTLLGSFMSVLLHFTVSMRQSRHALYISRVRLLRIGLLQPALVTIPALLLLPVWLSPSRLKLSVPLTCLWVIGTLLLAWFGCLTADDRLKLMNVAKRRTGLLAAATN